MRTLTIAQWEASKDVLEDDGWFVVRREGNVLTIAQAETASVA